MIWAVVYSVPDIINSDQSFVDLVEAENYGQARSKMQSRAGEHSSVTFAYPYVPIKGVK